MAWGIIGTFLLMVAVNAGQDLVTSPEQMTWTEARTFCRNHNSSLIPGTKAGFPVPHWTGYHHRLSDWIHVLGCYDNQAISGLMVPPAYSLERGSVGLCQERCGLKSFALQNNTCLCLSEAPDNVGVSPSRCDRNCSSDDDSHVNDCGGSDTYNVYRVTPRDKLDSGTTVNCVVLGCYEQWYQIHTDNCTEDIGRICQSEASTNKSVAPDERNFKSWSDTYVECRDRGGYLYGDINLTDSAQALCGRLYDIRSNTPETWLGVARQVYLTVDRGEESSGHVLDCSICYEQSAGCEYVAECNSNSIKATAVCGNADHLLFPMTTTTTSLEAPTQTPAPKTVDDDDSSRTAAIVVPIVVVVALIAVVGIYVYVRRRKKKSDSSDGTAAKKYQTNILYENSQNNGPPTAYTNSEKSQNFENHGGNFTKDPHIYHEVEPTEIKTAETKPEDKMLGVVDTKRPSEYAVSSQPIVGNEAEDAPRKSESEAEISSSVRGSGEDNKQSDVAAPVTTPEIDGEDKPEVVKATSSTDVVSGNAEPKVDSNRFLHQPYTEMVKNTHNSTIKTETDSNRRTGDETKPKPMSTSIAEPRAEKPANKKNVSVIQVCKF